MSVQRVRAARPGCRYWRAMTLARLMLGVLLALVLAGPAAASERSEARRFAAAMEPRIQLTPEEREALVAGVEARAARVASSCLPSVKAAARKRERALTIGLVYGAYVQFGFTAAAVAWQEEGDARLAAIHTRSKVLTRARAARAELTELLAALTAAAPADFCAVVTAWEATGFKGEPPGSEAISDAITDFDWSLFSRLGRGMRVLWRHGATSAQRQALAGNPRWPRLREPAVDPVAEAINSAAGREAPDDGPTRAPWASAARPRAAGTASAESRT
jgi:hypothetical protein